MKFFIKLTWSKIMAFVFMMLAFILDLHFDRGGQVFMFALPFAVFLITGKQVIDMKKKNND